MSPPCRKPILFWFLPILTEADKNEHRKRKEDIVMKKIWMISAAILMILAMALNVCAVEESITISNAEGIPGATVYLTVALNESVTGDALAITYTFDSEKLEALVDAHAWNKTGMLQDFDDKHVGVWASDSVTDFQGPVCVLAFRIRDDKAFRETDVACTVIVKNGSSDVGTYTANATVSLACNHSLGQWNGSDQYVHTRICEKCGQKQTQSHEWDSGTVSDHPENPALDIVTYTCAVCGNTLQNEISSEGDHQDPNAPGTQESIPTTVPSAPVTRPSDPPKNPDNQDNSSNQGNPGNQGSSTRPGEDHQHSGNQGSQNQNANNQGNANQNNTTQGNQNAGSSQNGYPVKEDPAVTQNPTDETHDHEQETLPVAVPVVTNPNATEHVHVHETENVVPQKPPLINVFVLFGSLAAAIGALLYFVRKKH